MLLSDLTKKEITEMERERRYKVTNIFQNCLVSGLRSRYLLVRAYSTKNSKIEPII